MIKFSTSQFFINFAAYLSGFLIIAAPLASLLQLRKRTIFQRAIVLLVCALVLFIPIKHLTIADYLRSAFQILSITTLLFLINGLTAQLFNRSFITRRERQIILIAIALIGLFFYPLTLGFSSFAPYQLGFNSLLFALALFLLTIICLILKQNAAAILLITAALAFDFRLLPSNNLWDYLIDPLITLYALWWCIAKGVKILLETHKTR